MKKIKISAIYIKPSQEETRTSVTEGLFRENYGLEGDCNSGPGDRQVCFLRREERQAVNADTRTGLCYRKFLETIQLEGVSEDILVSGSKFQAGTAVFEVSHVGKRCFPECEIVQAGEDCPLKKSGYLKVLKSGRIKIGDP